MKKILHLFLILCLFVLASCHTSKKSTAHRSKTPKFIDDIYMDSHNKNCTTAECIDKSVKYPEKKFAEKRHIERKSTTSSKSTKTENNQPTVSYNPNPINTAPPLGKKAAANMQEKYAAMLGINSNEATNLNLFQFIDEWYGVEYHMGGFDKNGIDCSGFTCKLYEAVYGMELVHSSHELYNECDRIKKTDNIEEGDLVFFKTHGRRISHVGVYLTNNFFVHASTSQGVVISSLKEEYWQKHWVGAGKMRK